MTTDEETTYVEQIFVTVITVHVTPIVANGERTAEQMAWEHIGLVRAHTPAAIYMTKDQAPSLDVVASLKGIGDSEKTIVRPV